MISRITNLLSNLRSMVGCAGSIALTRSMIFLGKSNILWVCAINGPFFIKGLAIGTNMSARFPNVPLYTSLVVVRKSPSPPTVRLFGAAFICSGFGAYLPKIEPQIVNKIHRVMRFVEISMSLHSRV